MGREGEGKEWVRRGGEGKGIGGKGREGKGRGGARACPPPLHIISGYATYTLELLVSTDKATV